MNIMKFKAVIFTNSTWGLPLINELYKMDILYGIVIPTKVHSENDQIIQFARQNRISLISVGKEHLKHELKDWLMEINPDVALCMTFPYLIPQAVLDIPAKGIVNFHFGKLPKYAGPDPVFWYLKEGKRTITITAHRMGLEFDQGQILFEKEVQIIPGENWGILGSRLSLSSVSMISSILSKIQESPENLKEIENVMNSKSIDLKSLQIDWVKQTADEIENLVNACNPKYGGAITNFRGVVVRILEVSPADLRNVHSFTPGNIVLADAHQGIFVLCSDYKFLRINLLWTPEGYISGQKLVALGVRGNEKFYTNEPIVESNATKDAMLS
ncbi:MAG: hypothetical protein DSY77_08360 [Bacteroidetes bacterium]|jgi:methionyl-tRNA formyltransferase|nr:MAG: hypothetical protein DSY77_08360 [Bacteroidota bacterium]